jgi:dUTP pyrophosphatase
VLVMPVLDLQLRVKRLRPEATLPKYATAGAAALDLYACRKPGDPRWVYGFAGGEVREHVPLDAGDFWVITTGIAIEIPIGYEGQVRGRSGLTRRGCLVHLGTIDADYRGEVGVIVENRTGDVWNVCEGDRIAQLVIAPIGVAALVDVGDGELSGTERGAGGFGSSGVR